MSFTTNILYAVAEQQACSLCSLRITGRDPDSSLGQKTLHSKDDVDAGSALLKYAGSVAPHSPPLPGALDRQKILEDPVSQELTPSDSR